MVSLENLAELTHKLYQETITPAELEILESGLAELGLSMDRMKVRQDKEIVELLTKAYQKAEASKARISERLQWTGRAPVRNINNNFRMLWAAAVLLLLVGSVSYLYQRNKDKGVARVNTLSAAQPAVLPGGNKATLRLANGTVITLDSANDTRMIFKQGNTNISRIDNRLTYSADKEEKPLEMAYNTLATPRGGQFQLELPDGSRVWLNAASSITYPVSFAGKDRTVTIAGEAYFEVAKDKARPFHVKVNNMDVQVLGTSFNINSYTDEPAVKTTLLEGSIKVALGQSAQGVVLKPGQQSQIVASEIKVINHVVTDDVVAWKNGAFHFEKADIYTVMRELSRWYDIQVEFEGKPTTHLFGGDIGRNLELNQLVENLGRNNIHIRIEGKIVTVMP